MLGRINNPGSLLLLCAVGLSAAAHVAVLGLIQDPRLLSNIIQLACPGITLVVCLRGAHTSSDSYLRGAWLRLAAAFGIWTLAQLVFLVALLRLGHAPAFPSSADALWLLFAFPMLLVTLSRKTRAKWEWVNRLDHAQACNFFLVLFLLVFSHPPAFAVAAAFNVQSVALLLACALRYSSTPPGPERIFFRNVTGFLVLYGGLTTIGSHFQELGVTTGNWVDLCWSLPFLLFCLGVLVTSPGQVPPLRSERGTTVWLPRHLHGLSALGLGIMSVSAAGLLASHRHFLGLFPLSAAFLLFTVRIIAQEAQLHAAHDKLQHSVLHDSLTGLANRTYLRRELTLRLEDSPHSATTLTLFFIDLDHFKSINDSLGHAFGDLLLVEVARLLRSSLRKEDFVVRLGGDEFIVMADCPESHTASDLADTLVRELRKPLHLEGKVIYVTASVGMVMAQPGMLGDDLLRDADCAMYAAKKNGKNQAQAFTSPRTDAAAKSGVLQGKSGFADAMSGAILHASSMLPPRSLHGHAGPVMAAAGMHAPGCAAEADVPLAQPPRESEAVPVGCSLEASHPDAQSLEGVLVLRAACLQVHEWNRVHFEGLPGRMQLTLKLPAGSTLLEAVVPALAGTRLPPGLLRLEVADSSSGSGLAEALASVSAAGIEVWLNDAPGETCSSDRAGLPAAPRETDQRLRPPDRSPPEPAAETPPMKAFG